MVSPTQRTYIKAFVCDESGVTLLETLVAVLLLGMVGFTLYVAVAQPTRALQDAQQSALRARELWTLQATMERDLSSAVAFGPFAPHKFRGLSDSMEWITRPHGLNGPLVGVRYEWVVDWSINDGASFGMGYWVRTTWPEGNAHVHGQEAFSSRMLQGNSVQLEYFDTHSGIWRTAWFEDERLPGAVRLEVAWPGEGETRTFSLTFPVFSNRGFTGRPPR